jgi:protein-tyrosine phosphatase
VLYRSDDLADLTRSDLNALSGLGLRTIFDLRHDSERSDHPNRLPAQDHLSVVELSVCYPPLDRVESRRKILGGKVEEGHFRELLIEANRAFALDFTTQWAELVHGLAVVGARPALIHCVDGKDRTGFAIALVLRALGVPQETVLEDYLLSNHMLQSRTAILAFLGSMGSLFRVSQGEIRSLLEVRPAYLESAFAAIDERYGSFTAYLREGLGLDDDTLARLRLAMLD